MEVDMPRGRADVNGERVLEVAADLLVRFGVDRTTLDDVARAAGVSKTTVYQRWGSRDALLLAVLRRERDNQHRRVRDEVCATAGPVDLRHLVAAQVRAFQQGPLMAAILLLDREVLGRLTETVRHDPVPRDSSIALLARLHAAGLLRTDRTLPELVAVLSAVHHGYFATAPMMPDQLRLPAAAAPELLGDTVHRAFARAEPLTPAETAALDAAIRDHVTEAAEPGGTLDTDSEDPS
jgi:AcrR family transcriptional regulator